VTRARLVSRLEARACDLRRARSDQQASRWPSWLPRPTVRQPAHSGMAQRRRGLPGPGAHARGLVLPHASAGLFRHSAALRRLRLAAPPSRLSTGRQATAGDLSLALFSRRFTVPFTAPTWPVPANGSSIVHLASDLRARLRPVARRGAGSDCARNIRPIRTVAYRSWLSPPSYCQLVSGSDAAPEPSSFFQTEKAF